MRGYLKNFKFAILLFSDSEIILDKKKKNVIVELDYW